MSEITEIATDSPDETEEPVDKPFDVEDLVAAGLSGSSSVLLVDQAGNVLGDLSLTLDSNQMPVFITHVAKAAETAEEPSSAIIELSEVSHNAKGKQKEEEHSEFNLKSWFTSFEEKVSKRLSEIEEKATALDLHCEQLKQKTQILASQVNKLSRVNAAFTGNGRNGTIIVGVPPSSSGDGIFPIITNVFGGTSTLQLITHNTKDDFPDGSWLGDPANPEMRVRCPIPQRDLDHVTKGCPTGEKMALTLLDYLFDRETQACSNISGNSKHGKKQLDPLKIYGIKCHIMHNFGVDDAMWQKIKLNLDSKCRTAFRRKLKGMPLTVKAFRDSRSGLPSLLNSEKDESGDRDGGDDEEEEDEEEEEEGGLSRLASLEEEEEMPPPKVARLMPAQRTYKYQPRLLPKTCLEEEDETAAVLSLMEVEGEDHLDEDPITIPLSQLYGEPQVLFASQTPQLIQTENGDFQLVQATPEQLAQIQQGHPIQILATASPDCIQEDPDPC